MSGTTTRCLSKPMAFANTFLGQLLFSDAWDHIFLGDEGTGYEILPRDTSFCTEKFVTHSGSSQLEGDNIVVHFFQYDGGSTISVGMKKVVEGNRDIWKPNSISIEILLIDQELAKRNGSKRLSVPVIKVWEKI